MKMLIDMINALPGMSELDSLELKDYRIKINLPYKEIRNPFRQK